MERKWQTLKTRNRFESDILFIHKRDLHPAFIPCLSIGRILNPAFLWAEPFKDALAYFHYNPLLELYY